MNAPDIKDNTIYALSYLTSMFKGPLPSIHVPTLSFWLTSLVWMIQFAKFLSSEQNENEFKHKEALRKVEDIRKAVFRAPNPKIFEEYPNKIYDLQRPYQDLLSLDNLENLSAEQVVEWQLKVEDSIQKILKTVLEITQFFSVDTVSLNSANIMIYYSKENHAHLIQKLIEKDKIIFKDRKDFSEFKGVLLTAPRCIVHEEPNKGGPDKNPIKREIPEIRIPVFEPITFQGKKYQNPGGALAIDEGNYTTNSKKEFLDSILSPTMAEEAREFFKSDGQDVESFSCYRIGTEKHPLGILNIDSSEVNILGADKAFLFTFNSLLSPVLSMLEFALLDFKTFVKQKALESLDD